MDVGALKSRQANQFEVIARDILAILLRKVRLHLQAKEHVAEHIEPWEKS